MSNRKIQKNSFKTVKIKCYGNTAAGKTTFLAAILQQLKKLGTEKIKFDSNADSFLKNWIDRHKRNLSAGTSVTTNLGIQIRNNAFFSGKTKIKLFSKLSENDWIPLLFTDERGEELTVRINDAGNDLRNSLNSKECDFLFFFFDPTNSDRQKEDTNLENFYKGEEKIVDILSKQVTEIRPQKILPIVFILTHKDKFNQQIEISVDKWMQQVFNNVHSAYIKQYKPEKVDSVLEKENIFVTVNSTKQNNPEILLPLDLIGEFVEPQETQTKWWKWIEKWWTWILGVISIIVLLIIGIVSVQHPPEEPPKSENPDSKRQPLEKDDKLIEINELIKTFNNLQLSEKPDDEILQKIRRDFHTSFEIIADKEKEEKYPEPVKQLRETICKTIDRIHKKVCNSNTNEIDYPIAVSQYVTDFTEDEKLILDVQHQDLLHDILQSRKNLITRDKQDKIKQAKQRISKISPQDRFKDQLSEIRQFLNDFSNDIGERRESIQQAINLAERFKTENKYEVILQSFGSLKSKDDMIMTIIVASKDVIKYDSSKSLGKKVTDCQAGIRQECTWQSGQSINLELKVYNGLLFGGTELAASKKSFDFDAIRLLRGSTQLKHANENWEKKQGKDKYQVTCTIQNISSEDWKSYDDYINPGREWAEPWD